MRLGVRKNQRVLLDLLIYLLIAGFAALQFAYRIRSSEFVDGETRYVDLGKSIVDHKPYSSNSQPETRFPPGFPLLLAAVSLVTGFEFGGLLGAMAVCSALAFVATIGKRSVRYSLKLVI